MVNVMKIKYLLNHILIIYPIFNILIGTEFFSII